MEERLLFKFYKSYFDVASELDDKNRLAFYDALMNKEFFGINPNLKGMANFAYISQKHSIEAQVKGWEDKMETTLHPIEPPTIPPTIPPTLHPIEPPTPQEKEEIKEEKKKEPNQISAEILDKRIRVENFLLKYFSKDYVTKNAISTIINLEKKYTSKQIEQAIRFGRTDEFWKSQFLSPNKLKTKNKDEVFYIDLFLAKSESKTIQSNSTVKPFSPINYEIPHDDYFGYTNEDLIKRCKDGLYKEKQS